MLSEHGYKISERNTTVAFVTVAREGLYHPVRQYLERIESDPSITPANISSLATDLLGNNNELANAMLRATVLGAVWRIFKPGSQFDSVCVLKGDQGLGKSKFWEHLAGEDWHTSSDAKDDKDQTLNIHSCWLYEMAELEAITGRKAAGELKNKITTRTDQFRAPYGRNTERHPRQSIFVGSVNDDRFLRDSTGSRRFWVVELHQAPDLARVRSERDAIWKAAVIAFRSGELPMLSPANQLLSSEQNGAYEQEDPWEAMLSAWAPTVPDPFTSAEALTGSGCRAKDQISKQDEMRVAEALKSLGFVQDKNPHLVKGVRARRWKSTQPAQPDKTSKREVVSGQNPYTAVDQPPLAQPTQPISESRDVVGGGGSLPATGEHAGDVFRQEVVSDETEPQIPCSAKSFADTTPHLPRLCQALSTVGLDTDPEPSPPWHPIALGIHAEHPDWLPCQIALHLGQGFERINGRDVKALLEARP
jgi:predicted P-loop ATPase